MNDNTLQVEELYPNKLFQIYHPYLKDGGTLTIFHILDVDKHSREMKGIYSIEIIPEKVYFKVIGIKDECITCIAYNCETNECLHKEEEFTNVTTCRDIKFLDYSYVQIPKDLVIEDYDSLLAL